MTPSSGEPDGLTRRALFLPRELLPRAAPVPDEPGPPALVELDAGRCTLCGACAHVCPTPALALEEGAEEIALLHDPAACNGCARCVETCPEGALAVRRDLDPDRLRQGRTSLLTARQARCTVCGRALPPLPMRRRLRELMPELAGTPVQLCTGCAAKTLGSKRQSSEST